MPKADNRMDDARRQGQFEGQVLTTLGEIKLKMENISSNYSGLELRVRANEQSINIHSEMFKDSEKAHFDLYEQIKVISESVKTLSGVVEGLIKYQATMRGIIIGLSILLPVVTSVITALIIKALHAN